MSTWSAWSMMKWMNQPASRMMERHRVKHVKPLPACHIYIDQMRKDDVTNTLCQQAFGTWDPTYCSKIGGAVSLMSPVIQPFWWTIQQKNILQGQPSAATGCVPTVGSSKLVSTAVMS